MNCSCPGWVETPAVRPALAAMTPEERASLAFPTPRVLIRPDEIADAVVKFIRDEALAGRVMVWPDGESRRLVPADARHSV